MKVIVIALCLLSVAVTVHCTGSEDRIKDQKLSDEQHFEGEEHNADYDHEAFLGDEAEEFNQLSPEESKERLAEIVKKIDTDGDGQVTEAELVAWIKQSQRRYVEADVQRQWESHAPAEQQAAEHLSWEQYQQATYGFVGEPEGTEEEQQQLQSMLARDKRRWDAADQDKDGQLSREEFAVFIHPEEAEHMKHLVVLETIEDMDKDGDGRISEDEYIGDMYDAEADGAAAAEEPEWVQHEREMFKTERDRDGDGYLSDDEVRAWILPAEYDHAAAESQHLLHEADADGDGRLSMQEILDKYDLFVGSQATDFGEALTGHDEL